MFTFKYIREKIAETDELIHNDNFDYHYKKRKLEELELEIKLANIKAEYNSIIKRI